MTTFATRPPLQQLDNPHMMSERGNGRRTSARLADKEDVPVTNRYTVDPMKRGQNALGSKPIKTNANFARAKTGNKRKPSE